MPKRSSKKPAPKDQPQVQPTEQSGTDQAPNTTEATPEGKNPAAVALGRLGGKKGGLARAAKLTKEQRREIAKKAAKARWSKSG